MSKLLSLLLTLTFIPHLSAQTYLPWEQITRNFGATGANVKALSHVQCFFENFENESFATKRPDDISFNDRCYAASEMKLSLKRTFAIIDYTRPSNERRMYLIDRQTGAISTMAAAHGRYEASFLNRTLDSRENSVKWARYFSNEPGSNAPSSGFFFAGQDYEGKFGRSLALHGIEPGINDYACERAVVIHKHLLVSKNNAYVMSSGCPMISRSYLDHVVNILKGKSGSNMRLTQTGGLVFIYGPREAKWASHTCL